MFGREEFVFLLCISVGVSSVQYAEPNCRFDHDYKVLQKLAELDSRINAIVKEAERPPCKPPCSNGWISFMGKCYLFNDRDELTWQDAVRFCSERDGQLVTIRNQEVDLFLQDFAKRLFKGDTNKGKWFWLGCTDLQTDGTWKWYSDGSLVRSVYTNWRSGQGDNAGKGNTQHCGVFWGNDGFTWHDYHCDKKSHFICQK